MYKLGPYKVEVILFWSEVSYGEVLGDKSTMYIRVTVLSHFFSIFFWFYFVSLYIWLHVLYVTEKSCLVALRSVAGIHRLFGETCCLDLRCQTRLSQHVLPKLVNFHQAVWRHIQKKTVFCSFITVVTPADTVLLLDNDRSFGLRPKSW
jgi:hypothetical protein